MGEEDLYSSCTMELFPSFLLLVLTWTAQKGFCKPMNSEEQMNMTDTTENRIPSGMNSMADGAQSEKTTDGGENSTNGGEIITNGGEKATNGGENSTNGAENSTNRGEKVTNGGENSTNGGEKVTNRGEEVKMMFRNRRLHTTEPDSKEGAGGLTLIDDMWLSDDQLPLGMGHTTGNQIFRQAMKGYRWPEKRLCYRLSKKFVPWQKRMIKDALKKIERKIGKNCVKFVDRTRKRGYAVE